ncbi:hypothetical protein E2C01_051488 [Portunus trituberculatus]|uniref:Uncharacterized protein n=1 Tax=Portunus trituberculatus TaxID=210409 RepID=A0A5B7GJN7_PORTR|nr:hypothetical protein [Portunus trituberculatus]
MMLPPKKIMRGSHLSRQKFMQGRTLSIAELWRAEGKGCVRPVRGLDRWLVGGRLRKKCPLARNKGRLGRRVIRLQYTYGLKLFF